MPFSPASSDSSTEDDGGDTDTAPFQDRGRRCSQNEKRTLLREDLKRRAIPPKRRPNGQNNSSSGKDVGSSPGITARDRGSFTRSRSPAVLPQIDININSVPCGPSSPSVFARYRQTGGGLLPSTLQFQMCFPFTCNGLAFYIDTRKAGESLLLLGSLIYASKNLSSNIQDDMQFEDWISIGFLIFGFLDL